MALINCPNCGSLISDQAATCPKCNVLINTNYDKNNEEAPCGNDDVNKDQQSFDIYNVIAWIFYIIGLADFFGMFLGYDFTGVSWSPLIFAAIGSTFNWLAKKK